MLQAHVIIGLLGNADSLLQSQVSLLTEGRENCCGSHVYTDILYEGTCSSAHTPPALYSLVAEATVQACQVESSVAETSTVALVPVALSLISRQDEAVEVMQEAVGGQEDVLDPHAVQVVQVMLRRE